MPARNTIKTYVKDGYYHIYNRGVEKRLIFQDAQDYRVFTDYMADYLLPKDEKDLLLKMSVPGISSKNKDRILKRLRLNNFNKQINLLAYCLMPNHFHLFVKQKDTGSIDGFMNSLCTRYVMYFNRKYQRVGPLFQGVYRAAVIDDEAYFSHISRYIHQQAISLSLTNDGVEQPSSYPEYIGQRKTDWVHPEEVLAQFSESDYRFSYARFVSEYNPLEMDKAVLIEN